VYVASAATASLEATLWHANGLPTSGPGAILTGTINVWGDPAFLDPGVGNYHIAPNSAATDTGIYAGVTTDMDGEIRPMKQGYDIGADEFFFIFYVYLPVTIREP
jgi:hypothetical protein